LKNFPGTHLDLLSRSINVFQKENAMNSEQINLVQSSFGAVRPIAIAAAELFYDRLFILDPSMRVLFKGDLPQQGRMFMNMLNSAVNGLSELHTLAPVLRTLGARHIKYGVRDEHYGTFGSALLWTLEQALGEKFTPDVREAWSTAYGLLSSVMLLGAIEARATRLAMA
jgi:hemoglobin-like flavoprotein